MSKKGSKTTSDYLPWEKAELLITQLYENEDYRMSLLVGCGCYFGLRVSELLSLTWNDIYLKQNLVVGERTIPIVKAFQKHIEKCHSALMICCLSEYCFLNRYGNTLSRQMVNRKLKKIKTTYKTPINNFSTHTLRKTWARKTYEEEGGGERALLLIAHAMNHSSSKYTKRYMGLE